MDIFNLRTLAAEIVVICQEAPTSTAQHIEGSHSSLLQTTLSATDVFNLRTLAAEIAKVNNETATETAHGMQGSCSSHQRPTTSSLVKMDPGIAAPTPVSASTVFPCSLEGYAAPSTDLWQHLSHQDHFESSLFSPLILSCYSGSERRSVSPCPSLPEPSSDEYRPPTPYKVSKLRQESYQCASADYTPSSPSTRPSSFCEGGLELNYDYGDDPSQWSLGPSTTSCSRRRRRVPRRPTSVMSLEKEQRSSSLTWSLSDSRREELDEPVSVRYDPYGYFKAAPLRRSSRKSGADRSTKRVPTAAARQSTRRTQADEITFPYPISKLENHMNVVAKEEEGEGRFDYWY